MAQVHRRYSKEEIARKGDEIECRKPKPGWCELAGPRCIAIDRPVGFAAPTGPPDDSQGEAEGRVSGPERRPG